MISESILLTQTGHSCLTHFTTKGKKNIFAIFLLLESAEGICVVRTYPKSWLSLSLSLSSSSSSHHCALLSLFSLYSILSKISNTFEISLAPSEFPIPVSTHFGITFQIKWWIDSLRLICLISNGFCFFHVRCVLPLLRTIDMFLSPIESTRNCVYWD